MRTTLAVCLLCIMPAAAGAQQAAPRPWVYGIDFGFNFASGNSSFAVLTTGLRATHKKTETSEFEWMGAVEYGKNQGVVNERRVTSSLKFDYLPDRTFSPFVFLSAEQDKARQIDLQAFGGGGLKFTFWKSPAGKASISGAVIDNYETFTAGRLTTVPSERTTRWSGRLKLLRKFGPALQIENTTFYQPVLTYGNDYNLSSQSAVTSKATAHLSLFVRHLYRRDSTPRAGVKSDDQRVTAGLRMEF